MLYRANFVSHRGTLQIVNTLHLQSGDVPWFDTFDTENPNPVDVANELDAQLTTLYRAMLRNSYTLDRITVTTVPNPSNPAQVPSAGEKPVGLLGTRAGSDDSLPPQMCGVIGLRTPNAGRSFRGRMFCPPVETSGEVQADVFAAAAPYATAINAFRAKLDDSFGAGSTWSTLWRDTWHMRVVVYSPTRHRQSFEPFATDVIATRFDASVHWLRSRAK